ncbi:MAG: ATP-binding protein [Saprospiraceae bacterium]
MNEVIEILILTLFAFATGFVAGKYKKGNGMNFDARGKKSIDPEKDMRDALLEERQNLYNMLDNLPMAFHLQGSDYSVPFANKVFRERFGAPEKRKCFDLMHNRTKPCEVCSTFRVFDNGEKVSTVWTAADGRTYLTVCTPFKDIEKGDLVMEMALDITDLEKAKKEAILAREVAEKSNKAKDDFLTQMSHEFRTPLNAILGLCQLLQIKELSRTEQMAWIDEIYKSGTHLLGLIVNILNYSSIDDAKAQINMEFLKVNNLMGEAIEPFQMLADEKGIAISANICSQDLYVNADSVWLERTLSNLISNAIKFNHKGGSVSISLSAVEEQVQIVVADTGKGIPAEQRDKVFEPFFRLERDVNLSHGVGIGLSMAKKIVEKMGGTIVLDSELGKGTRICVSFPSRIPRKI